ncbi:hypothetical protein RDWZM_008364 [Blomia tropicalis]|uniref:Uncharacterized protein n=1 Tax=Blomia tropicalis TaxID=40697 RepID=A0A9Q0M1M6_BLOTA|nr:hypothetical protein RDWZM_008364 [Blomia tropicalis]
MHSSSKGSSKKQIDSDPVTSDSKFNVANYEALFDSGYNSNMQSKTFLDEEEFNDETTTAPIQSNNSKNDHHSNENNSKTSANTQQWCDSGVCITDSGLSINEDMCEPCESSKSIDYSKVSEPNEPEPITWLKQNSEGDTLLHLAIIEDMEDIACSIIKNISGSNELLNSYNYLYQTPLHLAVLKRQMNVIQLLVSRGVSFMFQDNQGNTPLHIACKYSLTDIIRYFLVSSHKTLLSTNCFELRNYDGDTCIHLAAYNNNMKTIELLLRAGANINAQEGKSGKTILHWAVENLNDKLVYFLLNKCNASISIRSYSDQTAFHVAWKIQHSLRSDVTFQLYRTKLNKIVKSLLDKCDDAKLSLETLHTDSESDFSSSDNDDE